MRAKAPLPKIVLALLLLLAMGSGCLPQSDVSPSLPPTPAISAPAVPSDGKPLTLGIIYPISHPFYERITEDAEKVALARQVRLLVKAPDEAGLEQQIRMMETMIRQKVDGIAIDPIDEHVLAPIINKAVQNGIPVICFEADSPESMRTAFIGTDNEKAGAIMGQSIDRLLGGRGMVLVESGMSGSRSLNQRLEGMLRYLRDQTEVQVLDVRYHEGHTGRALTELEEMIEQHPHFDAFVALDFVSSSTSILVWKAKGLTRYSIAFGMTPEIKEAMINGQITAVISQKEEEWGKKIVESLIQATSGKSLPPFIDTGVVEVANDHADSLAKGTGEHSRQEQSPLPDAIPFFH